MTTPRGGLGALGLLLLLIGCAGEHAERAELHSVRALTGAAGSEIEIVQTLRLSEPMLAALDSGIALRLVYAISDCGRARPSEVALDLSYSALTRRYALRVASGEQRYFSRRSSLLAALDRVRLPLTQAPAAACAPTVAVHLDRAALPTPLRLPALLFAGEWRLQSLAHAIAAEGS